MIRGGTSYIFLTDTSGSVTAISGSCGCSDASYVYDPYGALVSKSAGSGGSLVTQNLIGYTGQLTDTFTAGSTGYVHDGTRWYNPQIGAFQTQDTSSYLANPSDGNRYAYAADNPVGNTDPTGKSVCTCFEAAGLGIGGSHRGRFRYCRSLHIRDRYRRHRSVAWDNLWHCLARNRAERCTKRSLQLGRANGTY
jgi:RHS repeat-associated protein